MKYSFLNECLLLLKRKDIRNEINTFLKPFLNEIITLLYPYIYLCLIFVILSFLLTLAIFILVLRIKKSDLKI